MYVCSGVGVGGPPRAPPCASRARTASKNNYLTEMCSGSEAGSYLRLIEFEGLGLQDLRGRGATARAASRVSRAKSESSAFSRRSVSTCSGQSLNLISAGSLFPSPFSFRLNDCPDEPHLNSESSAFSRRSVSTCHTVDWYSSQFENNYFT